MVGLCGWFAEGPKCLGINQTPPSPRASRGCPGDVLASQLLEQLWLNFSQLLFLVPTLGRKQFGEGNCKLALWLSPPA